MAGVLSMDSGATVTGAFETVEDWASFGGRMLVLDHEQPRRSAASMRVGVYLPPQAEHGPCPCLWYLSGPDLQLGQRHGEIRRPALRRRARPDRRVAPDTSPRGDGVPDDEAYDLGQGAGFYLDRHPSALVERISACTAYVTEELQALDHAEAFPVDRRAPGHHRALDGRATAR